MELLLILAGLLILDVLAIRFGVDSRTLGVRDGHPRSPGPRAV